MKNTNLFIDNAMRFDISNIPTIDKNLQLIFLHNDTNLVKRFMLASINTYFYLNTLFWTYLYYFGVPCKPQFPAFLLWSREF